MRPFPIYPLYTQTVILSLDKPIADCFLFRPRKSRKSAGNAVIPTFPTHWPHGLQHLRHKRRNARFKGLRRVHTPPVPPTAHTAAHRAKQGRFGWGRYHYPRCVLHGLETLRGRVSERQTLPLWGLGQGYSRRTQKAFGTAMRLCVSLFRGIAAPLGCVIFFAFVEIGICTSGAHGFPRVRGMGGITTLSALYVLLKRRTAACQNGSFAVF